MAETKYLKCSCNHCGGRIEFPAEGIGATISCPHCAASTELKLETPPKAAATAASGRSKKWIIAGIVILLAGLVGVVAALLAAKHLMQRAQQRAVAPAPGRARKTNAVTAKPSNPSVAKIAATMNDFAVSAVKIEKASGGSLVYATGTVRNETDKQRFGVTVEIELLSSAGKKIGTAKDYQATIEPHAQWMFRALLVAKDVASARVTAVTEQQ